jgi:hypothetical protein
MESPTSAKAEASSAVSAIPNCGKVSIPSAIQKTPPLRLNPKHQSFPIIFIPYLDNFSANFKAVCPPS